MEFCLRILWNFAKTNEICENLQIRVPRPPLSTQYSTVQYNSTVTSHHINENMEQKLQQLAKLVNDEKLPCSKAQKMLSDIQVSLESIIMNTSDHRSLLVHVDELIFLFSFSNFSSLLSPFIFLFNFFFSFQISFLIHLKD